MGGRGVYFPPLHGEVLEYCSGIGDSLFWRGFCLEWNPVRFLLSWELFLRAAPTHTRAVVSSVPNPRIGRVSTWVTFAHLWILVVVILNPICISSYFAVS